jgi:hypothetical protein
MILINGILVFNGSLIAVINFDVLKKKRTFGKLILFQLIFVLLNT